MRPDRQLPTQTPLRRLLPLLGKPFIEASTKAAAAGYAILTLLPLLGKPFIEAVLGR